MNRIRGFLALLLVCGSTGVGYGEGGLTPEPDPDAIIRKAIEARGGKEVLKRYIGYKWRAKGELWKGNERGLVKLEYLYRSDPMSSRLIGEVEFPSETVKQTMVFDGKRMWQNLNGLVQEGNAVDIEGLRISAYDYGVAYFFSLLDKKRFTLKNAPSKRINRSESYGVRVSCRGFHDVILYFDKNTSHLLKMESLWGEKYPHRDSQESYYEDYKEIKGGLKLFTKITLFINGKKNVEWELIEIEPLTEVKDSEFAKP